MRTTFHLLATLLIAPLATGCRGADRSARPVVSQSPLHQAAATGDAQRLEQLLSSKTDVNAPLRDGSDWTPLHLAAIEGHVEVTAALLARGADPNARGRYDMTPLHWAALRSHADVTTLLLRGGARPTARNIYGMTPLHQVADTDVARVLLEAKADPRAQDHGGMTPLHVARNRQVARVLLEHGADLRIRNRAGRTAWETTLWDGLEHQGLTFVATRRAARLRASTAETEVTVRNVWPRALVGVEISAASPACRVTVRPRRIPRFEPAQLVRLTLALHRTDGPAEGEHPLRVTFLAGGRPLGAVDFLVDTRRHETPEDRGLIPLGKGSLTPPPSKARYLAYAAVPLLLIGAWAMGWLFWRRRRSRAR